ESAFAEDRIGIMVEYTLSGLVYNTDWLAQSGVDVPTSWADLWNPDFTCVVLQEPIGGNKGTVMMNYVASGGDYLDYDATLANLIPVADNIVGVVGSAADAI